MSPSAACLESPLGPIAIVERAGTICGVRFGEPLARECKGPPAPVLALAMEQLAAYFSGELKTFSIPLWVDGTPFLRSVLARLLEVPYGQTVTYGAIAAAVGSSARAIGGACGRNPLPLLIPCHRVVGAGGLLTGYSGGTGLTTKAFLLRLEGVAFPPQDGTAIADRKGEEHEQGHPHS